MLTGLTAAWGLAVSTNAAALDASTQAAVVNYMHDTFERVCAARALAEQGERVAAGHDYAVYGDSDVDNELWLEDETFAERFPFRMTIRVGGAKRCQVAVWDEAQALFKPLVNKHEQALTGRYERGPGTAFVRDLENIRHEMVYHYPLPGAERNAKVKITEYKAGSVVIGRYEGKPIPYELPWGKWRKLADSPHAGGWAGNNAVAEYVLDKNRLLLWEAASEDWKFTLRPDLYAYRDAGQLRAVSAVELDGEPFAAFERCKDNAALCHTTASQFIMDLRRADVTALINGETLTVEVEARQGDDFRIKASLDSLSQAMKKVVFANHPELKEEHASGRTGDTAGSASPHSSSQGTAATRDAAPEMSFDPSRHLSRSRVRQCMERSLEVERMHERLKPEMDRLKARKERIDREQFEVDALKSRAESYVREGDSARHSIQIFCGQSGYTAQMQCTEARNKFRLARQRYQSAAQAYRGAHAELQRKREAHNEEGRAYKREVGRYERKIEWLEDKCETKNTGKQIFRGHLDEFCGIGSDKDYPLCDKVE